MQIIMIAFRTRQGGRLTQALLSAGSTWHARPLAASVCTVVPAAAVATGYSRTFVRPMRRLTHQPQLETVGKRHPRSLTRQGFDASVFRKRGGNRDRGLLGVLYPERILRMIHTQNEGIYRALIAQLDKLARHNRQESYKTRQRYYEAMQRFCRFLAEEYRLQKLTNISGKHLVDYVRHLQENGKAASTIKTELAAIRFWHDQISNTKHKLPSNADLADQAPLERRKLQGIDRHWTPEQFTAFTSACREEGREDYAAIATLTFYVGLRIHEACRLDTAAVEAWERFRTLRALRDIEGPKLLHVLTVKGKGGRVRSVPVEAGAAKQALRDRKAAVQRGHKLFVPDDVATDAYIHAFQAFLREHRPDQGTNPRPLTHHGMRHSYAARQYRAAVDSGASEYRAKLDVSHLLGHGRADVTDVYLASEKPENQ